MSATGTSVINQLQHAVAALRQMPDGDLANTLVVETIPRVAALVEAFRKVECVLAVTVLQIAPSDDQIISDHLRDAARISSDALRQFEKESP